MATLASNETVFYCTNCKEERTGPVTLACYHSVCQQCLTKTRMFHKEEENFCPVCDTNAQYSDSADSLRSQLSTCIDSASRTLEDLLVKSGLMYCSVCYLHNQHNKATHQCLDCADVLCNECHKGHQSSSATYSHRVVAIEDVNSGKYVVEAKKNFPCSETNHRGRTYAFFCQSCFIPICELCFLFQHKGHDVLTLNDAVQICSRKLDERSQQLSKYITDSSSTLERFRNLHRDISSIQEATVKCIRRKTKKAVDLILEQEQAAVRKLSKACDRQLKLTSTLSGDLEKISSLCPKLLSLTNLVRGPGQDTSLLLLHNDLEKCFNESKQLQDATDVFAAKLKTPVFVVRCDIPQNSVISIRHSFQNPDVGPGDSKKDGSMTHDKSASSVLSADDGAAGKQDEGMEDKSASSVLSADVVTVANADDGATRKQDEGMRHIPFSNSFTSESVITKSNPQLSDSKSKCRPGEVISETPFAVVAPKFKFESSISGFVVSDVLRSNENLFPEPPAVNGSSSSGCNICQLGDSSGFKLTASLMIVAETGKAFVVRSASARYPFEGPQISFSEKISGHMDSTKMKTSVPSAIGQGFTSDALMMEPMTSMELKVDGPDSLLPSGPVAKESSGLKGLNSTKPGASYRTFDDKQKALENVNSTNMIPAEPQKTETQDIIHVEPRKNTESPNMILSEPQNSELPNIILPEAQNTEPLDMIQPDPQNTETPDIILVEPCNTEPTDLNLEEPQKTKTPDMILAEPQKTETLDIIFAEPRNTEPLDMFLSEVQNTEPLDMILPDPKNTGTQDMVLAEPRNTETLDMILAEPQNTYTPDKIVAEPLNIKTPGMIFLEPQNTEIQGMILAEPLKSETPAVSWNKKPSAISSAEPLNIGHPEVIPCGAENWKAQNMISVVSGVRTQELVPAGSENRNSLDLIPARSQHLNTLGLIPAAPHHRRTLNQRIPAEPQNNKTPESQKGIQQSNCCIC